MRQRSAGILMFNRMKSALALLLVHPGGPYWANKDAGAWSIPKGLSADGEDELATAQREFREETGASAEGDFIKLGEFRQPSGKIIVAWAVEGQFDPETLVSNTFVIEWPPRSGRQREFVEVARRSRSSTTRRSRPTPSASAAWRTDGTPVTSSTGAVSERRVHEGRREGRARDGERVRPALVPTAGSSSTTATTTSRSGSRSP